MDIILKQRTNDKFVKEAAANSTHSHVQLVLMKTVYKTNLLNQPNITIKLISQYHQAPGLRSSFTNFSFLRLFKPKYISPNEGVIVAM